ncbi:MAG: hypothetical protein QXG03_11015 [Halalkalicoccus sp.]
MTSLTTARSIARTELRRSGRALRSNRYQLVATIAVSLLFFGPLLVFGSLGARALGETLAAGGELGVEPLAVVRAGVAGIWALVVFFVASRAVGKTAAPDEPAAILTAVPVSSALAGRLLAETVLVGLWVVVPALLIAGAFALGAGTPLVVVTTALALAFVLASAVPTGYLLGLGIRHLLTVVPVLARYKTAVGIVAFGLYFGAIAFAESLFADLLALVGRLPVGWLADLAAVGTVGIGPSFARAGAAVALAIGLGALATAGSIRLADRHWFADPARESRPTARRESSGRRFSAVDRLLSAQTRAVARVVWLRARRSPIRLLYAAYPLFGLVIFANDLAALVEYLPPVLALYVIWAAGAAFALNPLGDQAGALAATLTTPVSGERVVRGHLVVGAAVFVPLGLLAGVGTALAVGYPIERAALLGAASTLGVIGALALASGIGATFPRFGAVRLSGSHEAVMPSKSAFAVYSLAIGLAVAALALVASEGVRTVIALLATGLILDRFSLSIGPDALLTAGVIGLCCLLALPPAAYVHAVRRFDRFTLS